VFLEDSRGGGARVGGVLRALRRTLGALIVLLVFGLLFLGLGLTARRHEIHDGAAGGDLLAADAARAGVVLQGQEHGRHGFIVGGLLRRRLRRRGRRRLVHRRRRLDHHAKGQRPDLEYVVVFQGRFAA